MEIFLDCKEARQFSLNIEYSIFVNKKLYFVFIQSKVIVIIIVSLFYSYLNFLISSHH